MTFTLAWSGSHAALPRSLPVESEKLDCASLQPSWRCLSLTWLHHAPFKRSIYFSALGFSAYKMRSPASRIPVVLSTTGTHGGSQWGQLHDHLSLPTQVPPVTVGPSQVGQAQSSSPPLRLDMISTLTAVFTVATPTPTRRTGDRSLGPQVTPVHLSSPFLNRSTGNSGKKRQ